MQVSLAHIPYRKFYETKEFVMLYILIKSSTRIYELCEEITK